MSPDHLTPGHNESERAQSGATPEPRQPAARDYATDREVPLKRRHTPAEIHAWLDGDLPEAAVRRGDTARDVEFWNRINQQTDQRRRMQTPAHVYNQIMDALPQTTPRVITPWWRRPFGLTPAVAAVAGAAILALGAAVAALVMHAR